MLKAIVSAAALLGAMAGPAAAEVLIGLAAPMTGNMAWFGEQHEQALKAAAPELKAAEEAVGEPVRAVIVDDFCNGEQAVAAARKLVEAGARFVGGHACSGAAIPASAVYDEAGVLMIASTATNPALTDAGSPYVFRVVKRDTEQAAMVVERLAEHGAASRIAIVHDGEAYGQGLAEASLAMLAERSIEPALFDAVASGETDFKALLDRLEAAQVDVLFFAGYPPEAGLLIRQARDRGLAFEMIGVDSLASEYFLHVAGEAAEGVRFPSLKDLRQTSEAATVVERFRAQGYEPEGFTPCTTSPSSRSGPRRSRRRARPTRTHSRGDLRHRAGHDRLRSQRRRHRLRAVRVVHLAGRRLRPAGAKGGQVSGSTRGGGWRWAKEHIRPSSGWLLPLRLCWR